MASRPRPSLLALFDPLTISSESPLTPTRDYLSPSPSAESGSDKENVNSNTPKGSCAKTCGGGSSEAHAIKCAQLRLGNARGHGYSADADLLGSFSIEPKDNDTSNLCLVQLADELNDLCNITQDSVARGEPHREPLSEISISQLDGNNKTPQSVAKDKRLKKFGTPTVTPKSERKFAAGLSTPPISSPLALDGAVRTPRSLLSPKLDPSSVTRHTPLNAVHQTPEYTAPSLPFSSESPSLLSSTPAYDPKPIFQDPPSGFHGSSFEISGSLCMKKIDLSGDLLNDDLSFLARLEEDSFADSVRDGGSGRTARRSSKSTEEMDNNDGKISSEKHVSQRNVSVNGLGSETVDVVAKTPSRKASAVFRRSISSSGLVFSGGSNGIAASLASPIDLQPRTPLSSPFSKANDCERALAPKKSQAVLRKSKTLSRSCGSGFADKIKEEDDVELEMPQNSKIGYVRLRPSSTEIKPLARSQSFIVKQGDSAIVAPAPVRRNSISRPSTARRGSVGHELSPAKPIASKSQSSQEKNQNQNQESLTQSFRRLSVAASAKPTPVKSSNFATTGRMGGARRVPLTANAPLFKPIASPITEVQSPRPVSRATTTRTGPQRPPAAFGASATLGRSVSGPGLVAGADRTSTASLTRTISRSTSANSVAFSRSSFMTSSGSSTSTSRLPVPPMKGSSKIPGPGARKAF